MSALDACEPAVIAALQKAGYQVTDKPFTLWVERKRKYRVYADVRLEHKDDANRVIIVLEVKCFADSRYWLDDLYGAIGQYLIYRSAMKRMNEPGELVLAIPDSAWNDIFQRDAVRDTLGEIDLRVIVIDLEREEVVSWNP